jgi:hypothetical protein
VRRGFFVEELERGVVLEKFWAGTSRLAAQVWTLAGVKAFLDERVIYRRLTATVMGYDYFPGEAEHLRSSAPRLERTEVATCSR